MSTNYKDSSSSNKCSPSPQ